MIRVSGVRTDSCTDYLKIKLAVDLVRAHVLANRHLPISSVRLKGRDGRTIAAFRHVSLRSLPERPSVLRTSVSMLKWGARLMSLSICAVSASPTTRCATDQVEDVATLGRVGQLDGEAFGHATEDRSVNVVGSIRRAQH